MSKRVNSEEDLYVVLSWMYKYRACLPKLATKKLLEIDVIRQNYTKSTIYHMMCGVRSYINEGKTGSHLGNNHRRILDRIHLEHENQKPVYTEPVMKKHQPPKFTPEQELQKLNDQHEKLKVLREDKYHEIQHEITRLCEQRDGLITTIDEMLAEMENQIKFLQKEVLRGQILKEL